MEDQVKLIQGETLQGNILQFLIFLNQPVGNKGGSGATVYKAIQKSKPYDELVVKMTPYNQLNKDKLFKQIQIIRSLPDHPNIIKVLPIKINSEKFSYIFMEYCNQGTLQDLIIQRKGQFSTTQIFNIFYQVISGYKILWQNKILHQDLKPNNIFIKNKKFKIADFDLSIFHEGITFGSIRQGTFPYMSPQKLSIKQYHANSKSDIYSIGIIFFKLIFKHHPYVIEKVNSLKEYVQKLMINNVQISNIIISRMPIEMLQFLDIVLKMITKAENDRIGFGQLIQFVECTKLFDQFRKLQNQSVKHVTEEFIIQDQKNYNIVQHSQAIFIPFFDSKQQQNMYEKQLKQRQVKKQQQSYAELSYRIQKYLISMRLIVYFFDRLSRRLHVQYLNKVKNLKQNSQGKSIYEKVILSIIILAKKINEQTIKQKDLNQIFTSKQWQKYKMRKPQLLKLIQKDKQYIFLLLQDNLIQKGQCQIVQKRQIVKKGQINLSQYLKQVRKYLIQLIELRKVNIDPYHRKSIITLVYLISSLKIIDNFEEWVQRYQQIQNYFRAVETQSGDQLFNKIIAGFGEMNMQFTIFLEQQDQFQQLKLV